MEIKLYYTAHTRSLRPRWLLEELQIPYELRHVDLFGGEGQTPEYKKVHPLGQVPALQADGKIVLESGAICHWLTDQNLHKDLAPLVGEPLRAAYEQWMFFTPGTLEPVAWLVLMHTSILPEAKRCESIIPWALERHASTLAMLNNELGTRKYLLNDHFTTADIMVGSTLMWLPDLLKDYPALQSYAQGLKERPAYQRAIKE